MQSRRWRLLRGRDCGLLGCPEQDQDREAEAPEIVLTKAVVEPGAECLLRTSCRGVAAGASSREPASRRLTS